MPEKQEMLEDAEDMVLQDPRDRAKATLPESQSPAVETHTRCYGALTRRYQEQAVQVSRPATSDWQSDGQRGH